MRRDELKKWTREMWAARMQAIGYIDQKEIPMTTYTITEERTFEVALKNANLITAIDTVMGNLYRKSRSAGFEHQVIESFRLTARQGEVPDAKVGFHVEASATYARIVEAAQPEREPNDGAREPNEGDMDGEREARGPEEKDYFVMNEDDL